MHLSFSYKLREMSDKKYTIMAILQMTKSAIQFIGLQNDS